MKKLLFSTAPFLFGALMLTSCSKYEVIAPQTESSERATVFKQDATTSVTPESTTGNMHVEQIHIQQIALPCRQTGPKRGTGFCYTISKEEYAIVTIYDDNEKPLSNALVEGYWDGCISNSDIATTNTTGRAYFKGDRCRKNCTFTFTVSEVTHLELSYDPNQNKVSSASKSCE